MLVKTEGIVLNKFDYSDSSIIVKAYTYHFGIQTFLIKGAHRKKSTQKASFFQPLSILEIVFYHKEKQEIKTPKEIHLAHAYQSLQSNLLKATIAVFIAEILGKTIRETFPDERKYEFIKNSLLHFDIQEEGIVNFHLSFLLKLSNYLGFSIIQQEIDNCYQNYLEKLNKSYSSLSELNLTNNQRREILQLLLTFYCKHIEYIGEIKSLHVLKQVFD